MGNRTMMENADTKEVELPDKYLCQLQELINKSFSGKSGEIYLFGSRATQTNSSRSDIDLAVDSRTITAGELADLRETFEESTIPYTVDVVNLNEVGHELQDAVDSEGILIWNN